MQHRITIHRHGNKSGTAPGVPPTKHQRGTVSGWSPKAARRNTEFLQSVEYEGLTGLGLAFTGTVRDCPETSDDWHALRNAFVRRLKRLGLIRFHWVTEWQRRGVPHLHGMFFFDVGDTLEDAYTVFNGIISAWTDLAAPYHANHRGIHISQLTDAKGWAEYEAKHAARGVNHYQRCAENIPPGWKGRTGRVWGKGGDWPVQESMIMATDGPVFWRFRRLVRSWRKAHARASGKAHRIRYARRSLKCNNAKLSAVRGTTDWMPDGTTHQLLYAASVLAGGEVMQIG